MTPIHCDEYWMAQALQWADKGRFSTHPNPRVGCVVVRAGQLLAAGFHEFAGGPHAEINALRQLDYNANGCTVYVTLEPCSHSGKTPPCADALIKAGPERVVIAMQDPNPLVCGQGVQRLRQAGIEVESGVLEAQARRLNRGFIKRMQFNRPFVRLKMAASLDGRTALANGVSQWITGADARRDVQLLRAQSSAILSTAETVIADDASLNVRLDKHALNQQIDVRQPLRIILDRQLKLSGTEALFAIDSPILLVTTQDVSAHSALLQQPHVELVQISENSEGMIDLAALMQLLNEREINEIHTECGAGLAGALLRQGLVDEIVQYMAPCLFGSQALGLYDLREISIMSDRINLNIEDVRQVGDDIRITATPESRS